MVDISRMIVGVDIAKRVFQLYWVEKDTGEEMNVRLSRAKFLNHFANRAPCLVAMEACGGSQHWARRLLSYGHEVRILPAKVVRGFVRGNKNDAHDARAIWIAVQQPGVRTVAVKTEEQQAAVAAMGDPKAFKSGREFAAWLGLVPRHVGTGGRVKMLGISKRGDTYLRTLLIHGARSVLINSKAPPAWARRVAERRPANVATVALANKTARIIWALLAHDRTYQRDLVNQPG